MTHNMKTASLAVLLLVSACFAQTTTSGTVDALGNNVAPGVQSCTFEAKTCSVDFTAPGWVLPDGSVEPWTYYIWLTAPKKYAGFIVWHVFVLDAGKWTDTGVLQYNPHAHSLTVIEMAPGATIRIVATVVTGNPPADGIDVNTQAFRPEDFQPVN
jgi:hypothetical protein